MRTRKEQAWSWGIHCCICCVYTFLTPAKRTKKGNVTQSVEKYRKKNNSLTAKPVNLKKKASLEIVMSHSVRIYDTCIGCTQCVRACPTDVLEMTPWDGCKANQIASAPRTEDCVGCKRCESACPTDFLSVRVYLGSETTRSMGLSY